ncbi:MAG: ABC transporter substrate-binding protein [Gammaproteobacteria bacterium]|nr:ABC transporter substrate-binding protein [Gammaproteobacteria bacterium]
MSGLSIGFIPLLDCASLVAASERGFAAEEGLELTLVRETSWANIRDRLIVGHFDAAHMLGPMAVASTLGIGHVRVPLVAPCSLGLGGNAIAVSLRLWEQMKRAGGAAPGHPTVQGMALRRVVAARAREDLAPLTFGMVYPFSCHNYELRYWLAAAGVDPDRDVRIVVIPPPLLGDAMRAGQIDGFCVGEPWSSLAVEAGLAAILVPTTAIWPLSPEKVLGCRGEWAEHHRPELEALVRALYRAALWCERPENHAELAALLAEPRHVGIPQQLLLRGLTGRLILTPGGAAETHTDFFLPASRWATFPWTSHALWYYTQMVRWRQVELVAEHPALAAGTYRPDIYRAALAPLGVELPREDGKVELLFDNRVFDPSDLVGWLCR